MHISNNVVYVISMYMATHGLIKQVLDGCKHDLVLCADIAAQQALPWCVMQ